MCVEGGGVVAPPGEWNTVTLLELGTYYVLEAGKAAALGYVAALVQLQRRSYGRR